jgi:MYXO-CTERM domain-containing protein
MMSMAAIPVVVAHIALMSPTARGPDQKAGPCGLAGSVRGPNITTYQPGETITVVWKETIGHPGHYRISFDADGVDDFGDPAGYTDFNSNPAVLLDDITDMGGTGTYSVQVTLPDVTCGNCTLQLIQVMTDKPPWGPGGGNDIYYQCADLVLGTPEPPPDGGVPGTPDAAPPGTPDASPGGDDSPGDAGDGGDGDCAIAPGRSPGAPAALALLALALAAGTLRRRS